MHPNWWEQLLKTNYHWQDSMPMIKSIWVNSWQSWTHRDSSISTTETWQAIGCKRSANLQEDLKGSTLRIWKFLKKEDLFQSRKRKSTQEARRTITFLVMRRKKSKRNKAKIKTKLLRLKSKNTWRSFVPYAKNRNAAFSVKVIAREPSMNNARKSFNKRDLLTLMTFLRNSTLKNCVWRMITWNKCLTWHSCVKTVKPTHCSVWFVRVKEATMELSIRKTRKEKTKMEKILLRSQWLQKERKRMNWLNAPLQTVQNFSIQNAFSNMTPKNYSSTLMPTRCILGVLCIIVMLVESVVIQCQFTNASVVQRPFILVVWTKKR